MSRKVRRRQYHYVCGGRAGDRLFLSIPRPQCRHRTGLLPSLSGVFDGPGRVDDLSVIALAMATFAPIVLRAVIVEILDAIDGGER